MPSPTRVSLLALALFLAPAAAAQPQGGASQPAQEEEIVVTGEALEEQVQSFVRALTPAPVGGQLGRFERSVCPVAFGMTPTARATIAARIRRIADASGIAVGADDCAPNIVVIVTEDKRAFLQALRRQRPSFFDGLTPSQIRALLEVEGPAVAWHTPGPTLNGEGVELRSDGDFDQSLTNRTTRPASRITAPSRVTFGNAVLVVERRSLDGLNARQLADYAAMRTLAKADPARLTAPVPQTILTALTTPMGGAVANSLTDWDLSFLRGLYASRGDLYAPSQRGEIGSSMRRSLERQGGR
jgi:hypothetical protein